MSPNLPDQLFFGGDYNPEQWGREVWLEDVRLMKEAKVNLVTLAVFAWANIEISEGNFRFDWLDDIINLLHENGIGVDLATATASPPAWLTTNHPEILPVTQDGVRLSHGGRQGYCVSSPIYKEKATELALALAKRYASHPAIKMWHVNNEYGCHNALCFCDTSALSWRRWLQNRYESIDELNSAWGTHFWSQAYRDWDQINPPRQTPEGTYPNPTMMLDYRRFTNDEILELYKAERDAIRSVDSDHPITTNFMSMKHSKNLDYWQWANEVDFVSTDHYLIAEDENNFIDLAFQADLTRGFAGGKAWLLMEHSTSAVNWQESNLAKADGEMISNSLSHIARGSNGAMFFQWRQSVSGSEKFHSAMFPHAGENTRIWRRVKALGAQIAELSSIAGQPTEKAEIAMVFDYQSWWALSQRNLPSTHIDYPDLVHDWYQALYRLGVKVDFISPSVSPLTLANYRAVLMPMTYLLSDADERKFKEYQKQGGTLVVSYFTGISNEIDQVKLGGYGGSLVKDSLGLFVEEFSPLKDGTVVPLTNGMTATDWSQFAEVTTAEAIANFADGISSGHVALAKAKDGLSIYIGTRLTDSSLQALFGSLAKDLGLSLEHKVSRGGKTFSYDSQTFTVKVD